MSANTEQSKTKIISLDGIEVIKNYINGIKGEISNNIDSGTKKYLEEKLDLAGQNIKNDYEGKLKVLNDRLNYVEQNGNKEELEQIKLQIDALKNNTVDKFEALEALEKDIKRLSGEFDSLYEGITTNSIFSPGQLDEIIKTAMIKETEISKDAILTPEMYATKVVALIANFGKISAAQIEGGDITGHTIASNNYISNTTDPVWMIDNDGSGWLARKNISWDGKGNVEFGPNVKLSWNNVKDVPSDLGDGLSIFTSTVFIRSNEKPETPEGGNFDDPLPRISIENGINWEDSIPAGTDILWSSTRIFSSDAGYRQQSEWNEPRQMTDDIAFEVIYGVKTASLDKNDLPSPQYVKDNEGISNYNGWYDNDTNNPENEEFWYMATSSKSDGKWSEWNISKIKGEDGKDGPQGPEGPKGEKGKDGTSINISGKFDSFEELVLAFPTGPENPNDCYVINSELYVWMNNAWTNIGKFQGPKGEDGAQVYLHIKYASEIIYASDKTTITNVIFTNNNGEDTGPYQGLYSDYIKEDSTNWKDYKWFQIDALSAVTTQLTKYSITSNLISGKTMQPTTKKILVENTVYEKFNDDGTLENIYTAGKNDTEGPTWQLRNRGDGYLAKGNIRWDENGNVEFGSDVKLSWTNIKDAVNDNIEIPSGGNGDGSGSDWTEAAIKQLIQNTEIDGSKISTKTITANQIAAGTITAGEIATGVLSADTIIGTELVGKTIKSADDSWKIDNNGSGWLANKNISWDEDGTFNAKITGAFDGGISGNIANGALTWDKDGVHIHENLIFDEGKGISWENISGTDNVASKEDIPNLDDYATKEDLESVGGVTEERVTEISQYEISTATIRADQIDVDNIKISQLDTKPNQSQNKGKITIKDNNLSIYDKYSNKEIVSINGDYTEVSVETVKLISNANSTKTNINHAGSLNVSTGNASNSGCLFYNEEIITLGNYILSNYTYYIDGDLSVDSKIWYNLNDDYLTSGAGEMKLEYVVYIAKNKISTLLSDYDFEKIYSNAYSYKLYDITGINVSSSEGENTTHNINFRIPTSELDLPENLNEYNIYLAIMCTHLPNNEYSITGIQLNNTNETIRVIPEINKTILNSNGLKLIKNGDNYAKLYYDGKFEMFTNDKKYGLRLTYNGLEFTINGQKYKLKTEYLEKI